MAEYEEDKFIVINLRQIENIEHLGQQGLIRGELLKLMHLLQKSKISKHDYYVCSQDEPYAQKVIDVILEGEREKERRERNT